MSASARILLAGATLLAGSWIGLGKPSVEQVRARLEALAGAAPALAPPPPAPKSIEFGPLPQQKDANAIRSNAPWPQLNEERDIQKAWLIAEGPQRTARRLVTFTFDDGPFLETTPVVLRLLARYKVHATFFVLGQYLDGTMTRDRNTRRLLRDVVAQGHLVGNHSHDHLDLSAVTHEQALAQIDLGAASIERAIGKKSILFRPPFGAIDDFGRQAMKDRGQDVMLWSVSVGDMTRTDPHAMFRELANQLDYKEGGSVLLHDIRFTSIAALRELLAWLDERRWDPKEPAKPGFDIVDLPTYLKAVAEAPMPYESRDELMKAREQQHAKRRALAARPGEG